jgi:hypothetical protein
MNRWAIVGRPRRADSGSSRFILKQSLTCNSRDET